MRKDGFGKRMRIQRGNEIASTGGAQVTQVQLQLAVPPCGAVCGCWPRNTRGYPPLMLFVRQLSVSFSMFVPLLILMRFCHNSRLELSELFRTPCSLLLFVVTRGTKSGMITQHHIIQEIKLTSAINFFFLDLHKIVMMIKKKKKRLNKRKLKQRARK